MAEPQQLDSSVNSSWSPTTPHNKGRKTYIILGLVVVIIVALAYVMVGNSSSQHSLNITSTIATTTYTTIPSGPLTTGGRISLAELLKVGAGGFNGSTLSATYSGNIVFNSTNLRFALPFMIKFSKYYNDTRVEIYIYRNNITGNYSELAVKNGTKYYSCVASSIGTNYFCENVTTLGVNSNVFRIFDLSNPVVYNTINSISVDLSSASQSSYNGMPCTNTDGSFSYSFNQTAASASGLSSHFGSIGGLGEAAFKTCISTAYAVPLTLNVKLTERSQNVNITMIETTLNTTVLPPITTLPPPIQGSS